MTASIVGIVFLVLTIAWWAIQKLDDKKKIYRKAVEDAKKAVTNHDTDALLDALRRLSKF